MGMSELRDLVIDAHGGIERWSKVKTIDGDMSITGALWARKGWLDALKAAHVTADTTSQWINYRRFISGRPISRLAIGGTNDRHR